MEEVSYKFITSGKKALRDLLLLAGDTLEGINQTDSWQVQGLEDAATLSVSGRIVSRCY
jgi:hypothetical protein